MVMGDYYKREKKICLPVGYMIIVGRLLCPCDKLVIIVAVVRVICIDEDDRVAAVVTTLDVAASIIGNNFSVGIFVLFYFYFIFFFFIIIGRFQFFFFCDDFWLYFLYQFLF